MRTLKLKLCHFPKIIGYNKADPALNPARCHFFNNIIVLKKKKLNHEVIIAVTVGTIAYSELFLALRTKPAEKHVALGTTVGSCFLPSCSGPGRDGNTSRVLPLTRSDDKPKLTAGVNLRKVHCCLTGSALHCALRVQRNAQHTAETQLLSAGLDTYAVSE